MNLELYLSKNNLTVNAFAKKAKLSEQSVYKYIRGERLPRKLAMDKITHATKGQVTANSFYNE